MSKIENAKQYLAFHKGSVEASKQMTMRNVEAGLAGAAMFGAGLTAEVVAAITENPNIGVPGAVAMILGGIMAKDSYDTINEEVKNLIKEQDKVTRAEAKLDSQSI